MSKEEVGTYIDECQENEKKQIATFLKHLFKKPCQQVYNLLTLEQDANSYKRQVQNILKNYSNALTEESFKEFSKRKKDRNQKRKRAARFYSTMKDSEPTDEQPYSPSNPPYSPTSHRFSPSYSGNDSPIPEPDPPEKSILYSPSNPHY